MRHLVQFSSFLNKFQIEICHLEKVSNILEFCVMVRHELSEII
jgi:hypothetical protein